MAIAAAGLLAGFQSQTAPEKTWTIVVGGNVSGYLSPCGCTYPMSGGIRRWTAQVRALGRPSQTLVIENGGFVPTEGKQDLLKAEALAEALSTVNVAAINLTSAEARLGAGEISQLSQLANAKFVSSAPQASNELGVVPEIAKGPFLIGGASQTQDATPTATATRLAKHAQEQHLVPILMLEGDRKLATEIAKKAPLIHLIVYSGEADTPFAPTIVGKTMLVSPGEHGKELVRLSYVNGRFADYVAEGLGPTIKDDPEVAKIYAAYLRSVDRTNLIEQVPRKETGDYTGSEKCGSCHTEAITIWKDSRHHRSFTDLKAQGHSKDPDCVSCHVTGLDSVHGFRDLIRTPDLGYVGCESCHGPGAAHAADPTAVKLPKIEEPTCRSCHDPENSPQFNFLTYWKQIKHQ